MNNLIKAYFQGIWRDRFILWSLVNKDLQMKYRRSKLGVLWSILMPVGLSAIIGSVYSIIFGSDPREFIPLIFAGLNPWLFISSTADGATLAFIGAEGYLKQTNVNAQIFPLRVVLVNFVNLLYALLAFLAVYLFLQPEKFGAAMLLTIPGLIIMFFFALGFANIAAAINLNVRDYQPMQSLIFQGLFYATPIIFPASTLAEKGFSAVYEWNPFYYILEIVKVPLRGDLISSERVYLIASAITIVLFIISIFVVMKAKKGIAFKL